MADDRIRRQIAFLAAQMMYHRTETEYFTAKRKAAASLASNIGIGRATYPATRTSATRSRRWPAFTRGQSGWRLCATCGWTRCG